MNQTFDLGAVFTLDRNNKTSITHGDQCFLKIFALGRGLDDCIELFSDTQFCLIDLAAQITKLSARTVRKLFLRKNCVVDGVFQLAVWHQKLKQYIQRGALPFTAFAPVLDRADIVQHCRNIQQFPQRKVGTFFCFL